MLVDKGLASTKSKAQALIMSGLVFVNGQISDKSGRILPDDVHLSVKEVFPYVSRGALKLEKASQEFSLDFRGKTICDIGSSTGGFTDFALQNGATKVFAIDVGTGQLAQKIREDNRVIVMEKTDFRDVGIQGSDPYQGPTLSEPIDMFVCDVSFISLKKIIPKIVEIIQNSKLKTRNSAELVLLIKPQFEAGAKEVSRGKGVIKDEVLRQQIVTDIQTFAIEHNFKVIGVTESPITGAKGNVEYLLYLRF
jgi:23S rRNA (cytidine1920-2'-O)/16S rRNA (cytidine1409-2'-O)-methyltransferase